MMKRQNLLVFLVIASITLYHLYLSIHIIHIITNIHNFLTNQAKQLAHQQSIMTSAINPIPIDSFTSDEIDNLCDSSKKLKRNAKVLSYVVFGPRKMYYDGIPKVIKNARSMPLYKHWQIRIYHNGEIPINIVKEYEREKDVYFCDGRNVPRYGDLSKILKSLWRLLPMTDPSVDVLCPRDLDSAIISREEDAVKEFLQSGMTIHMMRDHQQHKETIMAGMWCFRTEYNRTLGRELLEAVLEKAKGYSRRIDQPIINTVINGLMYRKYKLTKRLQHDSYWCGFYKGTKPFPTKREGNTFVGCPSHLCKAKIRECPVNCRPSYGKNWTYC